MFDCVFCFFYYKEAYKDIKVDKVHLDCKQDFYAFYYRLKMLDKNVFLMS